MVREANHSYLTKHSRLAYICQEKQLNSLLMFVSKTDAQIIIISYLQNWFRIAFKRWASMFTIETD